MTAQPDTTAVFGSSPFAVFLAGLLAGDQSRKVALVHGPVDDGTRRAWLETTAAPVTRPDVWELVASLVPEVLHLLAEFDAKLLTRHEFLIAAHGEEARCRLDHMTASAATSAIAMTAGHTEDGGQTLTLHDQYRIDGGTLLAASPSWLARRGVCVHHRRDFEALALDGSCTIAGTRYGRTVLADDDALAWLGPHGDLDRAGRVVTGQWILTDPVPPLAASCMATLASGSRIVQAKSGALEIRCTGDDMPLPHDLAALIGGVPLRLAGRARFIRYVPEDGAPLIGATRRSRVIVICGLDMLGLTLAPAIARFLAGIASASENAWCVARRATRGPKTAHVAEHPASLAAPAP